MRNSDQIHKAQRERLYNKIHKWSVRSIMFGTGCLGVMATFLFYDYYFHVRPEKLRLRRVEAEKAISQQHSAKEQELVELQNSVDSEILFDKAANQ